MTPTVPSGVRDPLRAGIGTGVVFFVSGAFFGTWASRVPALRDQTGASESELGLALLVMGIGSLLTMPFAGRLCSRFGARAVVLVTAIVTGGSLIAAGGATSVGGLTVALFAFGFTFGAWDVAMNVHGHAAETAAGRPWMPRYHAMWSIGAVVGSAVGALMARAGVAPQTQFALVVVIALLVLAAALTTFLDDRAVHAEQAAEAAELAPGTEGAVGRLLSWRLAAIAVIILCGTVGEGAAADWLALLLIDERGVGEGAAAAGYTVFAIAMAATRLLGAGILAWRGRVVAIRLAGLVTAVGVAATLATDLLPVAYLGAALWGLGVALIFPACMSAGGDTPGRAADAIAVVAATGYAALLVGPPLIGFLGERSGLGTALWVVPVLAVVVVLLAPAMAEPSRRAGRASPPRATGPELAPRQP